MPTREPRSATASATRAPIWITAWAGNAAIAVDWVFHMEKFVNTGGYQGWSILIGLWIPAAVNLSGVRNSGFLQLWSTVLNFLLLVLMSTVGLFFTPELPTWPSTSPTAASRSVSS